MLDSTLFFADSIKRASGGVAIVTGAHIGAGSPDTNTFTTSAIDTTGCDFLVVAVGYFSAIVLSDSKTNSWSALTVKTNVDGNNSVVLYYCAAPIVGTGHTFTLTGLVSFGSIAVQGFRGVKAASPFDKENGATVTGATTLQPGNVAPVEDNELLVTAYTESVVGTLSINSGFTITDQTAVGSGAHFGVALAYLINGAGTLGVNVNPTWTKTGANDQSAAVIATFKKA